MIGLQKINSFFFGVKNAYWLSALVIQHSRVNGENLANVPNVLPLMMLHQNKIKIKNAFASIFYLGSACILCIYILSKMH